MGPKSPGTQGDTCKRMRIGVKGERQNERAKVDLLNRSRFPLREVSGVKVSRAPKSVVCALALNMLSPFGSYRLHTLSRGMTARRSRTSRECDCCHVLGARCHCNRGRALGRSRAWVTREGKDFLERKAAWPALRKI